MFDTAIALIMELWYFWLVILILIMYKFFRPRIKGWIGEKILAYFLYHLPNDQYRIMNNLLFQTQTGTTQIDHIIVSIYGIFVVETKNYNGWIFGDDSGKEWTQVIYQNKHKFMNPIHQNYAHIKAVEERLCDYENLPIVGIVAFSPTCTLKTNTKYNVVYFQNINKVIRKYQSKVLNETQLDSVVSSLIRTNINSIKNAKLHVQNIHEKQQHEQTVINQMDCPMCKGKLNLKSGKYGDFYGCTNYPVCQYTKKVEVK